MAAQNAIIPAETEETALVVFECKKDKSLKFRVEHHKLKAVTDQDFCAIPYMNESINSLKIAIVLSALDEYSKFDSY